MVYTNSREALRSSYKIQEVLIWKSNVLTDLCLFFFFFFDQFNGDNTCPLQRERLVLLIFFAFNIKHLYRLRGISAYHRA